MKTFKLLVLALILAMLPAGMVIDSGGGGGGPSGVAWTDSFTRTNNTDITANCSSEGPNGDCGWVELTVTAGIVSNELEIGTGSADQGHVTSDTDTTTTAHYSAAKYAGGLGNRNQGPTVRGEGGTGCFYTFRFQSTVKFELRSCNTASSCGTITAFTDGGGDFPDMVSGDSLGIDVDGGTGNNVKFTVWKFDAQSPPADHADWAGASNTTKYTVCTSGCDKGFTATPSAAKCNAEGKRPGIYSGSNNDGQWDDWVGGDV